VSRQDLISYCVLYFLIIIKVKFLLARGGRSFSSGSLSYFVWIEDLANEDGE